MNRKETMHKLIDVLAFELLQEIKQRENLNKDRWVAVAEINNDLELKFVAVPKDNTQYGEKGWLFAILARMLEDKGLVEFQKIGNNSYYRTCT
ncbi:hypothetical protein [Oceanobacter antarcticus]|uniref:Uncharacterized protein n=1 Tax=Oceanobacter antarcticus TaxID=3133425 RepID=A0ABW8NHZ5_9GAMM|tara:strand:+ start:1824 stop:2102 length:279 start_codon:yes stop_codon:yes gene_type:complete